MQKDNNAKKRNTIFDVIDDIGDSLMAADISIKINNHELSKDSKNNLSYVMTKDNIRTALQYHDKRFAFARVPLQDKSKET
jgi:hypothetical protein